MVPRGLEPRTLRLLAVRSNQLSYETSAKLVSASMLLSLWSRPRKAGRCCEQAGHSSVGRASDCRALQQSDGPWFDSGWPDGMTGPWLGPARPNLTASVPAAHARPTRFPPREEPKARPTAAAQAVSQPAATRSAQTSAGVRACLESAAPAGCPPRPGEAHGPGLRQRLDVVGPERASGLGELALETGEGMQFPSGNTRGTLPGAQRWGFRDTREAYGPQRRQLSGPRPGAPPLNSGRPSPASTPCPAARPSLPHLSHVGGVQLKASFCRGTPLALCSAPRFAARKLSAAWWPAWTHWDLNPGPSACEADVMPLHHVPFCLPTHACPRGACVLGR